MHDRRGYTILELLLVMIIIALLAAITYVKVAPALQRGRVRSAAGTLATDLQYAQVLAARYRTPIKVETDLAAKLYRIVDQAGTTTYRTRKLGLDGQYALDQFNAAPTTIRIFPNAIVDQSVVYTLGVAGYQRQVSFSRAGQIRVTTP